MELFPGDFSKGIWSLVSICQEQLDGKENVSNTCLVWVFFLTNERYQKAQTRRFWETFSLQNPIVWMLFSLLAEFLHFTALLRSWSRPAVLQMWMWAFKCNWHWSYTYLTALVCVLRGFLHLCMLERISVKYLQRVHRHTLGRVHKLWGKTAGLNTQTFYLLHLKYLGNMLKVLNSRARGTGEGGREDL